jgi:hypothetical protein
MDKAISEAFGTNKLAAKGEWKPMSGGLPLAALVGGALLYSGMHRGARQDAAQNEVRQDANRAYQANRFAGTDAALRGGVPLSPIGGSIYNNERADSNAVGDMSMFDKGASAAGLAAGKILAKQAGIGGAVLGGVKALGNAVKPGWKTKALLGAGALGAGYAATKGLRAANNFMQAPSGPREWGGHNAALPTGVSQFGVPTMG